jgi:hypothetical protein
MQCPKLPTRLLGRRKYVTIAAGFRCRDGVVLCADTEESGIGFKRKVAKIEFRPELWPSSKDAPIALFTGSGDGPFVDEIINRMWEAVKISGETELRKILRTMMLENRKYHREIWEVYPTMFSVDQLPDADLLFAVAAKDGFGLFSAASTRFKPIPGYATIGCGGELAHYICSDAYSSSTQRSVALAAHMLEQVKTSIPGCGGESYIAILGKSGAAHLLPREEAEEMGKHLAEGEQGLTQMLVASADFSISDQEFKYSVSAYSQNLLKSRRALRKLREGRNKKIEKAMKKIDDQIRKATMRGKAGSPTPSVSQTYDIEL